MRFVKAGHGPDMGDRQGILGQRAGLIDAQDNHRRRFVHGREACWQDALFRQGARAEGGREGEGGWQRDGDRRQDSGQDEGDDVSNRHLEIPGIGHQQYDDDAVEGGEIAHHA